MAKNTTENTMKLPSKEEIEVFFANPENQKRIKESQRRSEEISTILREKMTVTEEILTKPFDI